MDQLFHIYPYHLLKVVKERMIETGNRLDSPRSRAIIEEAKKQINERYEEIVIRITPEIIGDHWISFRESSKGFLYAQEECTTLEKGLAKKYYKLEDAMKRVEELEAETNENWYVQFWQGLK